MKKRVCLILTVVALALPMMFALTGCGGGRSLEDYSIVVSDEADDRTVNAAREVQKYIKKTYGDAPSLTADAMKENEKEILIGVVDRVVREEAIKDEFMTTMDYVIKVIDKKVVIAGASTFATAAAADKFLQLAEAEELQIKNGWSYEYHFDVENMNPICHDVSLFVPVWADRYTAPDWMHDPYETIYAVTHKNSCRMATLAHRTDFVYYPEGSLEGMLSSILAGADAVELDVRLTKDNIPVVLHDETLERLTNYGTRAGKDGLPESQYVGDWTYDELQQLNMLMSNGTPTEYKIPSLYECLIVAAQFGTQITFDEKADETSVPVFAATDSTCLLDDMESICLDTNTMGLLLHYYRHWKHVGSEEYFLSLEGQDEEYYKIVEFWFDCEEQGGTNKDWKFWDDARYKSWGQGGGYEKDSFWSLWYDEGVRLMWSNKVVDHCMYIAETYAPNDYSALVK